MMGNDQLLAAEVDDLLRSMPDLEKLNHLVSDVLEWRGRLAAVMDEMGGIYGIKLQQLLFGIDSTGGDRYYKGSVGLISLLHQARNALRLRSPTATSFVLNPGAVFEYFDEVRKIITTAKLEVFLSIPTLMRSLYLSFSLKLIKR